jgi:Ca2+-binding EF-hand superfamily protein
MSKYLPTVSDNNLLIWDAGKNKCGGYLQKKASQTSAFSKGKWQRRYFAIPLELNPRDNYQLEYFHSPEDKVPRAIMALTGATVKISSATAFVLNFPDGNTVSLNADSSEIMQNWVKTLESVISISNIREKMISQYATQEESGEEHEQHSDDDNDENPSPLRQFSKSKGGFVNKSSNKGWPTIRLDFDATSIPPASKERHQFIDMLCNDIAHSIGIDPSMIEVIAIKSAPGMDWLSLIEFDINLWNQERDENDSLSSSENNYLRKRELKKRYLKQLYEMIPDTSSILYNGYLTSKLDPSFSLNFVDKPLQSHGTPPGHGQSSLTSPMKNMTLNNNNTNALSSMKGGIGGMGGGGGAGNEIINEEIFSEDLNIMRIMQNYQDVQIPQDFVDYTHFEITLYFEGRVGVVSIPNPAILTKRYCALWPFEVKTVLGFMGTMQELWIDPIELIQRDTATKPTPIPFSASVRFGGLPIINAVHLVPDGAYDVKFLDRRDEAVNSLSTEEMDSIKETFQKCDLDGDGGISKYEMEEIVRSRTQERKMMIESKFNQFLQDSQDLSDEEIEFAEHNKLQYLQQLQESQIKLLKMFEAADLNGDGSISFTEFILAEAWWLRCTINPERIHLF